MKKRPIYLCSRTYGDTRESPPLGLLYVAQALKDAGHEVRVFHLKGPGDDSIVKASLSEKPLFVGFSSVLSGMLGADLKASRELREMGVKVVWGGVFASSVPRTVLRSGDVDFIVTGEGEAAAVKLAEAIENNEVPRGIPGVGYMEGEEAVIHPPDPPETDLDKFRLTVETLEPEKHVSMDFYEGKRIFYIPFSRGCPFKCSFCYNSMSDTRQVWRAHSAGFMKEMVDRLRKEHGVEIFVFTCDNVFGKLKPAMGIIEKLDIKWRGGIHLSMLGDDFLDWAVEASCNGLSFGLESGSASVLKRMNKTFSPGDIPERLAWVSKRGIRTNSSFIGMSPHETREELRETMAMMDLISRTIAGAALKFHIFKLYPKTIFWDEMIKAGMKPPATLDEWTRYSPSLYRELGYSDEQAYWTAFLANMLYSGGPAPMGTRLPLVKTYLSRTALNAPPSAPAAKLLTASQKAYRGVIKPLAKNLGS